MAECSIEWNSSQHWIEAALRGGTTKQRVRDWTGKPASEERARTWRGKPDGAAFERRNAQTFYIFLRYCPPTSNIAAVSCPIFILMPTQGEKWRPTGGYNERPPRFSWWGAGTLVGMVLLIIVMALVNC